METVHLSHAVTDNQRGWGSSAGVGRATLCQIVQTTRRLFRVKAQNSKTPSENKTAQDLRKGHRNPPNTNSSTAARPIKMPVSSAEVLSVLSPSPPAGTRGQDQVTTGDGEGRMRVAVAPLLLQQIPDTRPMWPTFLMDEEWKPAVVGSMAHPPIAHPSHH
eukprot:gene7368-biopygen9076